VRRIDEMDNNQETKHEKVFQKGDFPFPFEACEKMAETMEGDE
jgi:hypothetical protein